MIFMWQKLRKVRYIDFDKSKETKYTNLEGMLAHIREQRTVDSEFRDKVITYLKGRFPIIVDFKEATLEKVESDVVIDNGLDKGDTSIHACLEKYMKNVGRTFKGGSLGN